MVFRQIDTHMSTIYIPVSCIYIVQQKHHPFSGLRGNQNNFITQQQCEQTCDVFPNPCYRGEPYRGADNRPQRCNSLTTTSSCPTGHWCHVGADLDTTVCCQGGKSRFIFILQQHLDAAQACQMPMQTGEGAASLRRWYAIDYN
jgi:hypothetical protein